MQLHLEVKIMLKSHMILDLITCDSNVYLTLESQTPPLSLLGWPLWLTRNYLFDNLTVIIMSITIKSVWHFENKCKSQKYPHPKGSHTWLSKLPSIAILAPQGLHSILFPLEGNDISFAKDWVYKDLQPLPDGVEAHLNEVKMDAAKVVASSPPSPIQLSVAQAAHPI